MMNSSSTKETASTCNSSCNSGITSLVGVLTEV